MADTSIGIKIADGTFYPVLEEGNPGRKRVILTTVADNQAGAQIDLYRGNGTGISGATYIGTLVIDEIEPAQKGDPEIELIVKLDPDGNLDAQASDHVTGEHQTLSVALDSLTAGQTMEFPDFDLDERYQPELGVSPAEVTGLTADAHSSAASDFQAVEEDDRRLRRRRVLQYIGIAVLVAAVIAIIVLLILWFSRRPASATTAPASTTQSTQAPAPKPAQPAAASSAAGTSQPPPASAGTTHNREGGVVYQIRWGDTLWDLSISFYRTPWLYGKIAKANNIKNPNLIYAHTQIYIPER